MTLSSLVGVALTLALVLGLLAMTMRLLRKVSQGSPLGRAAGAVSLEVVQRISLGPRQGIAIVRIADQLVAVSVGEGGVRAIIEIDAVAAVATDASALDTASFAPAAPARDFRRALLHGLRSAGIPLVVVLSTMLGTSASNAGAQQPPHSGPRSGRRSGRPGHGSD